VIFTFELDLDILVSGHLAHTHTHTPNCSLYLDYWNDQ